MAEVESKKIQCESPVEPTPAPAPEPVEAPKDVAEEKSVIPVSPCEEKPDDCKALVIVESKSALSLIKLHVLCCLSCLVVSYIIFLKDRRKNSPDSLKLDISLHILI